MKKLLSVKTVLQAFYEKYSRYLDALFRFIFALITYLTVIYATGYNTRISSPYVAVLLSLIAAFLPRAAISVIAAFLIILEFASVSMEVAAVAGILFLLMLLVYFVFRPGDSSTSTSTSSWTPTPSSSTMSTSPTTSPSASTAAVTAPSTPATGAARKAPTTTSTISCGSCRPAR